LHFKDIPSHAFGDLKEAFWGMPGFLFTASVALPLVFIPADKDISAKLAGNPVFSSKVNNSIGLALSPYTIGGASLITFLIGTRVQNPKFSLASESLMESWVGSMAIVTGLKFAIRRQRPNGSNYSMPSAHSAAAFSTAAVLTDFYGWKAAIPSYTLASLVAFSRLDGQNHYLSDVLVGAAIGTALGIGTSEFHKKQHTDIFILPRVSTNEQGLILYKSF
jgi:membrane-associated phospholipid phosphatase